MDLTISFNDALLSGIKKEYNCFSNGLQTFQCKCLSCFNLGSYQISGQFIFDVKHIFYSD